VLKKLEAVGEGALVADKGQTANEFRLVALRFLICDLRTVGNTGTHDSEFVKDSKFGSGRITERC